MIKLLPFTPADFPRLLGWITSPELLVQWAGPSLFSYPLDESQLNTYLQLARGESPASMIFKISGESGGALGHIELGNINRLNGTASLCRVFIDPACRGKGICVEAVSQILAVGFEQLALRRIDLRVYSFNTGAVRCYERAGLVREGLLRQSQRLGHQVWDTLLYAILREEWEQ
jgi:RimJ/RimL family protein N-acetyltransferase